MILADITSRYRSTLILESYQDWLPEKSTVLDVGCGNGVVTRIIKKHFHTTITGCDIVNYLHVKIPFVQMISEDTLPFKKNSFDTVMFNDVLHHMAKENQEKLIQEALRIGRNVLLFEVQPTVVGKIFDYSLNKIHNPMMNIPLTFRTEKQWMQLFKKFDVKVKSKSVRKPLLYPFFHVAFLLHRI